jgi:hypothetical protein
MIDKLLIEWRKYIQEDQGPFDASALQLFMPSTSQCNGRKCSIEHFTSNMPRPIDQMGFIVKPKGGLWTATAHKIKEDIYDSQWTEWVQENAPHWFNPQGILIEPKSTNIFHIENNKDVKHLAKKFPKKNSGDLDFSMGPKIDWIRALSDEGYDGIHWGMKDGSDSESEFGYSHAWDVESTCWRPDAVQKGIIVPIKIVKINKN